MASRFEHDVTSTSLGRVRPITAVSLLLVGGLVSGCIPKLSCEYTRTCAAEGADASAGAGAAATADDALNSDGMTRWSSDAATPIDAGATLPPEITCERSTECTPELPYCDNVAKLCTGCRTDRDCTAGGAPACLRDDDHPQSSRCVECVVDEACKDGTCVDNVCVACNLNTNVGCEGSRPVCASIDGTPTCVACTVDDHCADTPKTPACSDNVCKACSIANPGHCTPEKPVCIDEGKTAHCVACTENDHCKGRSGGELCVQAHCTTCVLGTSEGCSPKAPFCAVAVPEAGEIKYLLPTQSDTPNPAQYLEYEHVCIECMDDDACGGNLPACFKGQCVECTENAHCTDPSASRCDTSTHTCVGCQAAGECAHRATARACDIEHGLCVECTAAEDTCYDDNVCRTIPGAGQYTCSATKKGQAILCAECLADSSCKDNAKCVLDVYEGHNGGWRCLPREGALPDGDKCVDFSVFRSSRTTTSIDGVMDRYCFLPTTSCQGYRDYGVGPLANGTCLTHDDCGLPDVDDGFCVPVSAQTNHCTYHCDSDRDCEGGHACGTLDGVGGGQARVCGLLQ